MALLLGLRLCIPTATCAALAAVPAASPSAAVSLLDLYDGEAVGDDEALDDSLGLHELVPGLDPEAAGPGLATPRSTEWPSGQLPPARLGQDRTRQRGSPEQAAWLAAERAKAKRASALGSTSGSREVGDFVPGELQIDKPISSSKAMPQRTREDIGEARVPEFGSRIVPRYHVLQEFMHVVVCSFWLFMIATIPLAVAVWDGELTWAHVVQAFVLFAVVVSGVMMCVSVITFKSIHWEGARHLTIVETVYVMSQILTTVGYGDITPAHQEGQILVGVFVMIAVVLFADIIHQMGRFGAKQLDASRHTAASQELRQRLELWERRAGLSPSRPGSARRAWACHGTKDEGRHEPKANCRTRVRSVMVAAIGMHKDGAVGPYVKLARAGLVYIFLIVGGAAFWQHYPGEGKTYFEGLYMSVITLTSTGLGDLVPETEGGQVFVAFWSVFGVAALINGCAALTEVMAFGRQPRSLGAPRSRSRERREFQEACQSVGCSDAGKLDQLQFLKLSLLQSGLATTDDLTRVDTAFRRLAEGSGEDGPCAVPVEALWPIATPIVTQPATH